MSYTLPAGGIRPRADLLPAMRTSLPQIPFWGRIATRVPVDKLSGSLAHIGWGMKNPRTPTATGYGSQHGIVDLDAMEFTDFSCVAYRAGKFLDRTIGQAYAELDPEVATAAEAMNAIHGDLDRIAAAALFNTTTWPISGTTGYQTAASWDSPTNGKPANDFIEAVNILAAKMPGTSSRISELRVVMNDAVARQIVATDHYQKSMYHGFRPVDMRVDEAALSAYFSGAQVRILDGGHTTSDTGNPVTVDRIADPTRQFCWVGYLGDMFNVPTALAAFVFQDFQVDSAESMNPLGTEFAVSTTMQIRTVTNASRLGVLIDVKV